MNGIDLVRVVHASRPGLPIIIITARREPALLQAAVDAEYVRICKALYSAALLNAIAAVSDIAAVIRIAVREHFNVLTM